MLDWKPGTRRDCMGRRRRQWHSTCGRYKVFESRLKGLTRRFYAEVRGQRGTYRPVVYARGIGKTFRTERTAKRACEKHARACDAAAARGVTKGEGREARGLPALEKAGSV